MWLARPISLSVIVFSKPSKIERVIINDAVPSITPMIEMYVMKDTKFLDFLALINLSTIINSNFILTLSYQ